MTKESKIAVIGLGKIGTAVATNLVKGNRPVIVADRTTQKAEELAKNIGNLAQPLDITAAIKEADLIVLAVYFDVIKELFKTFSTEFQGKIIIDPSNPIAPDEAGGFKKTIDKDESSGQLLSKLLPEGAKLAKALGSLGVDSLSQKAFQEPEKAVLFYATDDTNINNVVEDLIRATGFEPLTVGGIDQSIRIEVFGDLHEFGALGHVVTLAEAKAKL